jgi:hypothetical protein
MVDKPHANDLRFLWVELSRFQPPPQLDQSCRKLAVTPT